MSALHSVSIISQGDLENFALLQTRAGLMIKARHRHKNVDVSVNLMTNLQDRSFTELLSDVASTGCIRSARVLPLMGVYFCPQFLGVVSEWMYNGSLWSLIHEVDLYPNVPVPLRVRILLDVAEGMSCLHGMEPPVLHQTLKSSNVLLDKDYRAKVSDYSMCKWRKMAKASAPLSCVEPCNEDIVYMSPEQLQGKPPSTKGDVYSYGMLAFEVLTRRAYEDKWNLQDLVSVIIDGGRPNITAEVLPASLPLRDTLIQLTTRCWAQEPQDRPQFKDCVTILRNEFDTYDSKVMLKAVNIVAVTQQRILESNKDVCPTQLFCIDVKNLEVHYDHKLPLNKKLYLETEDLKSDGNPIPVNLESKCSPMPLNISNHQRFPSHTTQQKGIVSAIQLFPAHLTHTSIHPSEAPSVPPNQVKKEVEPLIQQNVCISTGQSEHTISNVQLAKIPCIQILKECRECLIKSMTEGRLNHILDVLRSQQLLTKSDYETITASITRSGRTRALLDTCLCLGEEPAKIVVSLLAGGKKVK